MTLPPLLVQTAGSLAAILALAGLAWGLKLGGEPLLADDDRVREAAGEVEDGFAPVAIAHDSTGHTAIARDAAGRIMVIKRHGNRFAGRMLDPTASARFEGGRLVVDPGETRFGMVMIDTAEADAWVEAINQLQGNGHA